MMLPITIFRVSGHSMESTLHAGQFVMVNRWTSPKVGDLVVAFDAERNIKVIKRAIRRMGNREWRIESDNKGHGSPIIVSNSEIIGRVIWY